jgi:excisionase family DNA binding protein
MEKLLLSPNEVAEALGIGRPKVYSLLSRGELPRVRVGRSVRVPAAALRKWVEERGSNTADARPEPERA